VEYDIFEVVEDRSVRWHACSRGTTAVFATLEQFAKKVTNECFAIRLSTQTILARVKHHNQGNRHS
jgi:hypothetical protein